MQTRKAIEYDEKTLLPTVLDTMKSLRHADNVAHPKPQKAQTNARAFQSKKKQMKSERE